MKGPRSPNTKNQLSPGEREEKELAQQFQRWEEFLNTAIGLVSLNLALACLGTHRPSTFAAVCFVFILALRISGAGLLPEPLRLAKENPEAKARLKEITKRHMSLKHLFTRYLPFLMGYLFLMAVMFGHLFAMRFPTLQPCIDDFLGPLN
jgi:hypothetical protein